MEPERITYHCEISLRTEVILGSLCKALYSTEQGKMINHLCAGPILGAVYEIRLPMKTLQYS